MAVEIAAATLVDVEFSKTLAHVLQPALIGARRGFSKPTAIVGDGYLHSSVPIAKAEPQ